MKIPTPLDVIRGAADRVGDAAEWTADTAETVAGRVVDIAAPGDSLVERAMSPISGSSPLVPHHGAWLLRENIGDVVRDSDPEWCGPLKPVCAVGKAGAEVSAGWSNVESFITHRLPGGWWVVAAVVLFLLGRFVWRVIVPPSVQASKAAARAAVTAARPVVTEATHAAIATRAPAVATAMGIPPARGRFRRAGIPVPWGGSHVGVSGRVEIVEETSDLGIELCCDADLDPDVALASRRRGWRLNSVGGRLECPDNPAKIHYVGRKVRVR